MRVLALAVLLHPLLETLPSEEESQSRTLHPGFGARPVTGGPAALQGARTGPEEITVGIWP